MDKDDINCERQIRSDQALKIIEETFKSLDLETEYRSVGNKIKTYHCKLTDNANNWTFYGCGKGIGIQSKVSASFEAYEHYLGFIYLTNKENTNVFFSTISKMETEVNELLKFELLPKKFLNENKEKKFPWIKLSSFNSTNDPFYSPLFLLEPRYTKGYQFEEDESDFNNYSYLSSDSGTASGTSFTEAAIHALNESIERDAISQFLVKSFINNEPIKHIDKKTLPNHLSNYVEEIEKTHQEDLIIADITSDIGVPTFYVCFTNQNSLIPPKGFGTSLNKSYALERALLESLQPIHLRTKSFEENEKNILNQLSQYPLLQKAAKGDLGELIKSNQRITTSFNSGEPEIIYESLEHQLHQIINKLNQKGIIPRYLQLNNPDDRVYCLKTIVPGLDKFFIVTEGKVVMPSKRSLKSCRSYN